MVRRSERSEARSEDGEEQSGRTRQFEFARERASEKETRTHDDLGRGREEAIQTEGWNEVGLLVEERLGVVEEVHPVDRVQISSLVVAEAADPLHDLSWSKDRRRSEECVPGDLQRPLE